MKKTNARFLIDIVLLLLLLILLEQRATGNMIHEWLGITLFLFIVVHIFLHLNWINCAISHFRVFDNQIRFILNMLMLAVLVTTMFSGLMISREVLPAISGHSDNHFFWRSLHDISADVLLVLTGIHLALNWHRILTCFKKAFFARKIAPAQDQPSTLQALPSSGKSCLRPAKTVQKNKQVTGILKLVIFLVLFSAGISSGWYYISQNSQVRQSTLQIRTDDQGTLPARFNRDLRRHQAGPAGNHHQGRRYQISLPGMFPGIVQNVSVLFLLVFLTVMAREHFRSPQQINR